MKARLLFCLSILSCILAVAVFVNADGENAVKQTNSKTESQSRIPIPKYTSTQKLPDDITVAKLSNGLTVIVQENHAAPVATVRCFVKNTGSAFEGKNLGAGLSHVLEHVAAGGTTLRHKEKEIEKIVNAFGGVTNAATSLDQTMYYIDCPAKNTMTAIGLIADSMQRVAFEPSEFNRELKVVRRELADGEVDRGRVLFAMLYQTVYATHPVRHPVIGYIDVLNATTNQTIIDFYRERYVPNNQVFVVVGDVKTQAVLDEIAKQYAGVPRGRETYVNFEAEPRQLSPREAVREMEGVTYDMTFAWPTVKLSHPDLFALDVAAYILGTGESSRLTERLRNQEQVVLGVGAGSDTPHYVDGMFLITASARPETWKKASEGILREVYRLRDELVSPEELAKAKKQKAAELIFSRQKIQQMADSFGHNMLATGDPLFDKAYVEGIQRVTAEQIRDVARRYFVPERLNRVIIAPPGGGPKSAAKTGEAKEGEVRKVTLDNGLRVLLKRDAKLPLVNMQAVVLGGSLLDDESTAGRAAMLGHMLERGTAKHSALQIAEYFDSIGGQFGTGAGRFTFFTSMSVLKEDFPTAAGLLAECFLEPAFPKDEFDKVQKLVLASIEARCDEPQSEISEMFFNNLPAASPYHILQEGTKESVGKLTPDALRALHAKILSPQNMVVTVFGDIESQKALELVQSHFGGLKSTPRAKPISFDRPNAIEKNVVKHKSIGKSTGMVMVGYPTASILDKKEYAAMTLLDSIMSGYSYPSGWLHNELRGAGLVYSVHAFQMTGPVPGFFTVVAQTQPEKVNEVVERIGRNIDRAKSGNITDEEFSQAVKMVIAHHAQENTAVGEQAQRAAVEELYGLGYDYNKTFDARIEAVTLQDVIAAAKKYFSGNRIVITTSSEEKAAK